MSTPTVNNNLPHSLRIKPKMWHGQFGCERAHFEQHIAGKDLKVIEQRSSKHPDQVFRVVDQTGEEWTVFKSWCQQINIEESKQSFVLVDDSQIETPKFN